jgi:hypothetical protein
MEERKVRPVYRRTRKEERKERRWRCMGVQRRKRKEERWRCSYRLTRKEWRKVEVYRRTRKEERWRWVYGRTRKEGAPRCLGVQGRKEGR